MDCNATHSTVRSNMMKLHSFFVGDQRDSMRECVLLFPILLKENNLQGNNFMLCVRNHIKKFFFSLVEKHENHATGKFLVNGKNNREVNNAE